MLEWNVSLVSIWNIKLFEEYGLYLLRIDMEKIKELKIILNVFLFPFQSCTIKCLFYYLVSLLLGMVKVF